MSYYAINNSEHLEHYGVLGMKWGIRRYQPYSVVPRRSGKGGKEMGEAKDYKYKSMGTKKYERKTARTQKKMDKAAAKGNTRKYNKLEVKRNVYKSRADRSAAMDAREQEYAERVSVGGNIAARLLTGGAVGGKPYQQYLAMDKAQGTGHIGTKAVAAVLAAWGGRPLSTFVKSRHLREDDNKVKRETRKEQANRATQAIKEVRNDTQNASNDMAKAVSEYKKKRSHR